MTRWLVLLLPMALAGCGGDAAPVEVAAALRPAMIHVVEAGAALERHRFVARLEAAQSVDLSFEVAGPLAEVQAREGQRIPAGTLVAALDPLDHELAQREARVQLDLARRDLERKRSLLARNGISQSLVDDAQAQFELREVALAKATEALADTRIHAPFDAYVAQRFIDPGVNVVRGTPIARLLDLRQVHVVANVRETLLATLDPERVRSLHAEFAFAPGRRFPLTFHENRGEADPVAQTYEISFAMPYPGDLNLLPGMTATVHVELFPATAGNGLAIPASALVADVERPDRFFVWRWDPDSGAVQHQPVELGPVTGAGVLVTDGLQPGDRIVSGGAAQLQAGMRVRALGTP